MGLTHNEAKGKPRMGLYDTPSSVPAVIALEDHATVALHFLPESVLATREDETHDGPRFALAKSYEYCIYILIGEFKR